MKKEDCTYRCWQTEKLSGTSSRTLERCRCRIPTIAEELIALTEYDNTHVTEALREIEVQAHQVNENLFSQYPFEKKVAVFLKNIQEKSPMWYTLLMAQFRDTAKPS